VPNIFFLAEDCHRTSRVDPDREYDSDDLEPDKESDALGVKAGRPTEIVLLLKELSTVCPGMHRFTLVLREKQGQRDWDDLFDVRGWRIQAPLLESANRASWLN
jgi:hypothetical protein